MIENQKRIIFFTLFLILSIISANLLIISNQRSHTSTMDPSFQKKQGQGFSFYHQFLKIEITGSFNSANWTLYHHDLIRNSSSLLINTTLYLDPVILKLDIGFYTLQVGVNSSNPVTITTTYYGLSARSIILCLLTGGITVISFLVISINLKLRFHQN